jgi:hypothetical protein
VDELNANSRIINLTNVPGNYTKVALSGEIKRSGSWEQQVKEISKAQAEGMMWSWSSAINL